MDRWSQLSLKDKSDLMSLYIQNGISSLEEIKKHYNSFQAGGPVPSKTPNFVQRFNEGNKRDIPFQGGHATHLLSYAERDGKYYVYPEVQPTDYNNSNSPLQYYGRDWRVAFDRAYDNNDYLEFDTEEAARNYSENYKKVPSTGAVLNGRNRGNYNILDYMRGYATGGHLYQDGGPDDDKTFVSSQASETGWMPEVKVEAERPSWQQGLNDYDWARARQYYSNPDGTLTSRGFEFLKNVASKNRTGTSNYMRDVNKLSYIPNAAVGAIGAIPIAAGLIASAPVIAEAAAPYVVPAVKSMFGIKNLAGLGLSMGVATGVDQTISDNSDYKNLPDWANQTFFNGSPETEQALEFFRPEYMFAPYTSKVVNKGIGLVNNAANAVKPLYNSKAAPVLADALYKDASFNSDPIMKMLYSDYINGKSTFGNLFPQKTIQTGLDDDAIQLLRNRTLNRNIQAIKEDPNLSSSFLGESRIKKLNEIFDKDLPSIKVGKYSGKDYKNAGHGDWGGFYNEENRFISLNRDSGYPMRKTQAHEGLHYIDSKHSLTTEQDAALSKAFDDDFNILPETEYAPEHLKGYTHMRNERITTNRDARDELLGYEDIPLEKQNQIIDQATDDAIFNAVENANGYGRAYIKRLRAENKLTHEKANAFRESMKKVGAITGIIGTGAPLLNNNKN